MKKLSLGILGSVALFGLAQLHAGVALAGSGGAGVSSGKGAIDYEAAFVRSFPAHGDEHEILSWPLYAALVNDDLVGYAAALDPAIAARVAATSGKGFQTADLKAQLVHDQSLVASFADHRRRVREMQVYTEGQLGSDGKQPCRRALVYVAQEFRLVFGEDVQGGDPLGVATIAPSCPANAEVGFQITAGRSPRFKCWSASERTLCGYRLPDMPVELKRVVEDDYPAAIKLRWRWRGLRGAARVRAYADNERGSNGVFVTIPNDLALEFVNAGNKVLWTASAAGMAKTSAPRAR